MKNYKPKYHVDAVKVIDELKKYMLVDGFDLVLDLKKSANPYFLDKRTGKKYFDFFTCFASLPIGLNNPGLMDEGFLKYLAETAINKPSNSDIYSEQQATFMKTFFKVAVPSYFKYSFYIDGGALAVCNALKTAFDWKVRKNIRKGYNSERGHQIIHFKEAFHGRSGYTMSLTNTDPRKIDYYPKFDWPRIINPKLTFPLILKNIEKAIELENRAIEEIKLAFSNNKDDIAAIIIEPIQGEGGDNHFRPEFLQSLRRLADENEALLIFDEVQTGVGITGTFWAHEQMNVHPDIMVFGKKMQICGILSTDRIDDEPENVFHSSSRINSTWGGNLVDMVRATRYLEIIEEENLVNNAKEMGKKLMSSLQGLSEEFPDLISNIRGRGLFCAFDLPSHAEQDRLKNKCYDDGMLILGCGSSSIRFRPPLNINEEQLKEGMEITRKALQDL